MSTSTRGRFRFSERPWENGSVPIPYGTPESAIQGLVIMVSPVNVHLINLLLDGVEALPVFHESVCARLGLPLTSAEVEQRLEGLVHTGFARRNDRGIIVARSEDEYRWRNTEIARHLALLEAMGDEEQAQDCRLALDAAWDARSIEPVRHSRARLFARSEAGKRLDERYRDRTLGFLDGELPWHDDRHDDDVETF
ncbi:hypothetical protein [Frondihabitans cladoniiphilus]|uniref:Uncharacterized protein n=1 Tax=Frondihabitans cladoniiphilus TaxID=715785 RepID=A0ABP8VUD2_9MICO